MPIAIWTPKAALAGKVSFALVGLAFLLSAENGCTDRVNQGISQHPADSRDQVIKIGYGIKAAHFGMAVSELDHSWGENGEPFDIGKGKTEQYLQNRRAGMELRHDGTHVDAVIFFFMPVEDHRKFAGEIEGGLNGASSIKDVIQLIGQPTTIWINDTDEGEITELLFLEKGTTFEFTDKKLSTVSIHKPRTDYPPDLLDFGDTSEYRAIEPNQRQNR